MSSNKMFENPNSYDAIAFRDPANWNALVKDRQLTGFQYVNPYNQTTQNASVYQFTQNTNLPKRDDRWSGSYGGSHKRARRNSKKQKRVRHTRRKQTRRHRHSRRR